MDRTFNYKEVVCALRALGFKEMSGSRTGHSFSFIRTVFCQNNESHQIRIPIRTKKKENVHPKTLKTILTAIGLTENEFLAVLNKKLKKADYEVLIRQKPKKELMNYLK